MVLKRRRATRSSIRQATYAQAVSLEEKLGWRQGRPPKLWIKGPAIVLFLVSAFFLYKWLSDPRFQVQEVLVTGNQITSDEAIRAQLEIRGQSIFTVNVRAIEKRLEDRISTIANAQVKARLPDQVWITLEDRPVLALWETGGTYWWVDPEGTVLGPCQDPANWPVVHDRSDLAPEPKGVIAGVPWDMVRQLFASLPALRECDYTLEDGLTIYITDQRWPVHLGYAGDVRFKIEVMLSLARRLGEEKRRVAEIDLRSQRHPAVRLQP